MKREQKAAEHLAELAHEPFVKQVRGIMWGMDTGLLTYTEAIVALSKFLQAEEARSV